jgi:hypothetical protein
VNSLLYLGTVVTSLGRAEEDIKKANGTFVQLYPIQKNRNILRKVKLQIFNSNISSVLLYGCETQKVTKMITHQLQTFTSHFLHHIINMRWPDVMSNEELWDKTN